MHGLSAPPLRVRLYSLLIDALLVTLLSIMFAGTVFVALRALDERFDLRNLFAMPWYLLAVIPVVLGISYKALWAVIEYPTIGLQSFGLDVIRLHGHRPTRRRPRP